MTFDTNVSKVRLRLLLSKVKQNCIVILPYFGLNYNFLWYCFFRQIYIIITYYVIFFVLRFFSWQKGVQSSVDCTPFLRFQHLKIPYYFYYFFWKSRATVAHFFGTVISLFFPTASTFFGRVVYARGPWTTRPHHENFLHSFSFSPLQCFKRKKRRCNLGEGFTSFFAFSIV